ncbi:MAG: hypothetical protein BWY81_00442 [Firmicutes bacterium ADurb.Bin467]|nr:MAG: hypothetical protein BWY81_00442 [Firmicutes bacterium ADurb.Bin467]
MYCMPRVVTIGSTLPYAMIEPLTTPHSAPTPMPISISHRSGMLCLTVATVRTPSTRTSTSAAESAFRMNMPVTIADSAMMPPIEMSMEPTSSTHIMPVASTASTAVSSTMNSILSPVRNSGFRRLTSAIRSAMIAIRPISRYLINSV